MKKSRLPLMAVFFLCCSTFGLDKVFSADHGSPPLGLIYDTDIGNDVDDVLALGVIHALQSRGACQLLAVTISKDHPLAGRFTDCINTFYGRGNIPIGVVHSGVTPKQGKFIGLAEQFDNDHWRYPHDFKPEDATDAVMVLRKALATAQDQSVVIAQVGFSTNLARLLESKSDAISPLSGVELIKKKVRLLAVMAGSFEKIKNAQGELREHREYNVVKDIPSAQKVAADWPTPLVWSGYEIGESVTYPSASILWDYSYVAHHPLAEAYHLYSPPPHNRPTWDLTAVLYVVQPDHGYFDVSPPGVVAIADDGLSTFTPQKNGAHRYLILSPEQRIRLTEALVQLSSQPPK
ncbi:MAG: nucleoside hydrolase [Pirellulales bacterium]